MSAKIQSSGINGYVSPKLFQFNLATDQGFVTSTSSSSIDEYDYLDWGTL